MFYGVDPSDDDDRSNLKPGTKTSGLPGTERTFLITYKK